MKKTPINDNIPPKENNGYKSYGILELKCADPAFAQFDTEMR